VIKRATSALLLLVVLSMQPGPASWAPRSEESAPSEHVAVHKEHDPHTHEDHKVLVPRRPSRVTRRTDRKESV
jgi:hypothetical protein